MLSERLRELRIRKEISNGDLAKEFNIASSTLSSYENGNREPKLDGLIQMAQYFNVSTDYLLGLTNEKRYYDNEIKIIPPTLFDLFEKFGSLSKEEQEIIEIVLEGLLARRNI